MPHTQGLLICPEICPGKDSAETIPIHVSLAVSATWHMPQHVGSNVATAGEYAGMFDLRDLSTNLSRMRESTAYVTQDRV